MQGLRQHQHPHPHQQQQLRLDLQAGRRSTNSWKRAGQTKVLIRVRVVLLPVAQPAGIPGAAIDEQQQRNVQHGCPRPMIRHWRLQSRCAAALLHNI
jgi:hypothetical protein